MKTTKTYRICRNGRENTVLVRDDDDDDDDGNKTKGGVGLSLDG